MVWMVCACFGGMSWVIIEMIFHKTRKMSLYGFCSGSVAALVGITPASGFVRPHFAVLIGVLSRNLFLLYESFKFIQLKLQNFL